MSDDRRKLPGPPHFTPVPRKVSVTTTDDEVSGVHDVKDLWRKMDRRTSQLLDYAKSTEAKADDAKTAATELATRVDEQRVRIESMETALRAGHHCTQSGVITQLQDQVEKGLDQLQTDIQEGIKTRSLAKQAKEASEKAQSSWKAFWGTVGGSMLVLILTGASAVYYFGQLDERVTQQNNHQVEATKRVEGQVKQINSKIGTIDDGQRIERLTKAVEASNGNETTNEYCSGLSDAAVARMKRVLPRDEWPRCRRFGLGPVRHH